MTSVLRSLQNEWNSLVPQARGRGIPRVRPLRVDANGTPTVLETIAYRRAKLEWLKAQLGSSSSFDTLTFGVEIECIVPHSITDDQLAAAIRAAGVDCRSEVYNHLTRGNWKIVTDGSLTTTTAGRGREIVSPPLRGEDGFVQLRKVCQVLTDRGCKVNRSCGLHVHVGAANQHVRFFKNLAILYASAQGAIDQFMAPSRRGSSNSYCQPVRMSQDALDRANTVTEVAQALGQNSAQNGRNSSRYRKLNFASFWQHGTVEFRHHQGTVDAVKAENWTRLCLRMCLAAVEPDAKRAGSIEELFEVVKAADAERSFFRGRVEFFRTRPGL